MIRIFFRGLLSALLFCGTGCVASHARTSEQSQRPAPDAPARAYLARLRAGIERARLQMPEIIRSAQRAAQNVTHGAHLYLAGSQTDFIAEFNGRAGGLMAISAAPKLLERGDVVLFAARSRFTNNDKLSIARWRDSGALVIAFASRALSKQPYFPADVIIDSGDEPGLALAHTKQICPTDSVINVINGWTWTGEFISACTRLGKMPVIYRSYGLDGGRAWAEKYHGKTFHDDLTVTPVNTGTLGSAYLDHLERYLDTQAEAPQARELARAAQWLNAEGPARSGLFVMGHLFPDHYQDARAPRLFGTMTNWETIPPGHRPSMSPLTVMIGYQHAPQLLIDLARQRRIKLIYSSVERAPNDVHENVIYIDPHWPIEDACVTLSGYPQPMLPASGVMQAAIYWSMVAAAK
jgi:uncharacterized phosphosugar-binding protein